MRLTVNEVSKKCGVSIRALHYYDETGLLKPCETTEAGYRLYSEKELKRLQQILFLRELDMPIKEIPALLRQGDNAQAEMLKRHKELLTLKRDRLSALITLCEQLIKGEDTMDFIPFDQTNIENAKEAYQKEARERWGGSDAYKESAKRENKRTGKDNEQMEKEQNAIFAAFGAQVGQSADSAPVQALVKEWQDHITKWHYPCGKEILASLGLMYTGDERFQKTLDAFGQGTAKLMSDAIAVYCAK